MRFPLTELINIANSVTNNSEPCTWYSDSFKVTFENINNGNNFWLFIDQEALQYAEGAYKFILPETGKIIWLQFYKHVAITPKTLPSM